MQTRSYHNCSDLHLTVLLHQSNLPDTLLLCFLLFFLYWVRFLDPLLIIAATNENGDEKGLLIANVGAETTVETNLESGFKVYEIDEKHMFAESPLNAKSFVLGNNKVVYLEKA